MCSQCEQRGSANSHQICHAGDAKPFEHEHIANQDQAEPYRQQHQQADRRIKRHDLIAITLNDPREINLPDCGLIALHDAETYEEYVIDSSDKRVREDYRQSNQNRLNKRANLFNSIGMDFIDVYTDQSYVDQIIKFFLKRKGKG